MNTATATKTASLSLVSRRKHPRFTFMRPADWDFFTEASGSKSGFIENISRGGALLCTSEAIEHRRWIRIMFREPEQNLWFTLVGRVVRREDRIESWNDQEITLYRYGLELIHPLNSVILERIQEQHSACALCGEASAQIPDTAAPGRLYCVTCHLRRACQNLLIFPDTA